MEPIVTGAAANLASEATKGIFQEAKRNIRYVMVYRKNVEQFEEKLQRLIAKRTSVQEDVDAARRNVQEIKADVKEWCNRVDEKMDQEKKKVQDLQGIANNKCFIGLCPPIKSRHRLSRRAEEGATTFQELINQAGQLSTPVGYWNVPEDIEDDKPPKDFEVFESRQKLFNDILKALEDATISMIGVHGMGGVGKSTLLEEVVRKVKKAKLFDQVVMVTVTENPDILNIQDQIAELLGLELKEKTAKARALRLQRRFKGEKEDEEKEKVEKQKEERFLLILDDLWAKLNFTDVGIPFEVEQKRCKILLASRSKGVLLEFDEMHDQNTFHIALLDDKEEVGEAWHLFKKKVRSISPELETLGNKIAKRCGGLPLAISAVAQSLRNKSRFAWENALKELEKPSSGGLKDISSAVYTALKLSYNHIEGEEAKRFFLFCSLLSHNTLIEDLLTYTIGLGLLPDDDDYTVEQARNKVLTWIENLKASGLLLDSYSNDRFNMHDILCDVAKSIASEEKNGMLPLKQEDVLKSWPEVKAMKERNWINLRLASNTMLPDEVHCPELTFLHILGEDPSIKVSPHPSKNDCSTKVPPYFFNKVEMLKVLDLTRMDLSSFPSSLGLLSSLQTLCLHNSVLGDIALVGEIRTLKILSLRDSDIERLPEEIGQLVQLRLLNLTSCTQLRTIPAGIFSKLTKLEELYMRESFSEWKAEGDASRQSNASFDELSSLSLLTTLEVHIPNAKMVNGDFSFFKELKRYKIYIGREGRFNWFHGYEYSMTLQHSRALQLINVNVSINDLHHEIKMLLGKSEYLYLDRLEGITIALDELKDGEGFSNLKKLHIKNWSGIQYIIGDERNEFQELRSDGKGSTSNTQHQCLPLLGQK
ncbi:Disease resistance protein, partial [Corchorus olitorius]